MSLNLIRSTKYKKAKNLFLDFFRDNNGSYLTKFNESDPNYTYNYRNNSFDDLGLRNFFFLIDAYHNCYFSIFLFNLLIFVFRKKKILVW